MAAEAEERREAVRKALVEANKILSWKRVHRVAKNAGFELTTGAENLGKFANEEVLELNPKDQLKLERFFASETGHVICGKDRKNGTLALLTDLLRKSAKHPDKRDMTGWYYAFHGSYIEPGHLVVRAIEIEPKLDGLLHVRNVYVIRTRYMGAFLKRSVTSPSRKESRTLSPITAITRSEPSCLSAISFRPLVAS